MKGRLPMLRAWAKWGGLSLAAVSIVLFAASAVRMVSLTAGRVSVLVMSGSVVFEWRGGPPRPAPSRALAVMPLLPSSRFLHVLNAGLPGLPMRSGGGWMWGTTLDVPAALGLLVGVPAWALARRDRRRKAAGHCPKCGYDRSGIPEAAPCPECGAGAKSAGVGMAPRARRSDADGLKRRPG